MNEELERARSRIRLLVNMEELLEFLRSEREGIRVPAMYRLCDLLGDQTDVDQRRLVKKAIMALRGKSVLGKIPQASAFIDHILANCPRVSVDAIKSSMSSLSEDDKAFLSEASLRICAQARLNG